MRHQLTMRAHHHQHHRFEHHHAPARRRAPLGRAVQFLVDRFLLVPLGACIGLVWANTSPVSYFTFAHRLSFPVNEIGMALFFALITHEVVEATMPGGVLHSWRSRGMPIVAAAGGIAGAALTYLAYIHYKYEYALLPGWPIALAVDVVATYYVLRLIMPRGAGVPFALLLAIVTDIVGMIVVAPRYQGLETGVGGVGLMLAALGFAGILRSAKVRSFLPYLLICGPIAWVAFYLEGLHPAFSLVPIVVFLPREARKRDVFADPPDDDAVHHAEHEWNEVVQVVVFLFGLVNAGVIVSDYGNASWAMLAAALVGRPAGILVAVGIAALAGLHLPRQIGWRELVVIAFAASSGFTVGLFFATGMLATGPVLAEVKFGVLMSAFGALVALGTAWALKVGRFAS
jgi:Na+:H+ antiporter, NhaA family